MLRAQVRFNGTRPALCSCSPQVARLTLPPSSSRRGVAVSKWVCHAADTGGGDGRQRIVEGPISYNPGAPLPVPDSVTAASEPRGVKPPVDRSQGLWTRCDKCGVILYIKHLKEHNHICFGCQHHMKMSSMERVDLLIDPNTWRPLDETLSPVDPLTFSDMRPYVDRIKESQERTGLQDAVRTGTGLMHGIPIALGVMDFDFMGGSMGSVVGEKLTRLIEYATCEGLSLIIVSTSGGARMQEGIMSLMQMAKISGALHVHQTRANLLFISLLTSPTTGGVTASFGMLGDLIIAEPQAIIGFAGRRVIEQTLQEELPDDFQTAEYLMDHGLLDLVVPRSFLKGALYEVIAFYKDAPFKRRGVAPFGVQHGTFLTTEEKVRRRWAEWRDAASRGGDGAAAADADDVDAGVTGQLAGPQAGASVAYRDLVRSFERLVAADSSGAGAGGPEEASAAASTDARELVGNEALLSEAMAAARGGLLQWVEQPSADAPDGAGQRYVFRIEPDVHTAAPAARKALP